MRVEKVPSGCSLLAVALVGGVAASAIASYGIGHVSVTFDDPDRVDRPVPAEIFYPADEPGEGVPVAPAPAGGFPAVVIGHAFGGGATILAAHAESTIRAIVNLAAQNGPRPSPANLADEVTVPALVFAASHDCVTPPASHQLPIYENLGSSWKTYVCLTGGSHCKFSGPDPDCHAAESGRRTPTVSAAQQQAAVLDLLLPWLAAVLKDDQAAGEEIQRRLEATSDISFLQAGALPVRR